MWSPPCSPARNWFASPGPSPAAEPKTICYRLLHVAARLATHAGEHVMRIDRTWPWRHDLANAYTRLRHALP